MDNNRLLELAGVKEASDSETRQRVQAISQGLSRASDALVDIQDEVIGMKHEDRDALMYALNQAGNALSQIKQIIRRHTAF